MATRPPSTSSQIHESGERHACTGTSISRTGALCRADPADPSGRSIRLRRSPPARVSFLPLAMPRLTILSWLLAGLAALCFGLLRAIELRWVCDDAFISFRYAQNLIDGHGLVFNAGERVEGYTNFL